MNYICMYIDHSRSMYLVNPSYTLVVESHARPIPRCSYPSIGERTGSQRCEVPRWHVVARRRSAEMGDTQKVRDFGSLPSGKLT